MKRIYLVAVAVWFFTSISAQTDSMFLHLDKSSVTSGILREHGVDTLYKLYEFDGQQAWPSRCPCVP